MKVIKRIGFFVVMVFAFYSFTFTLLNAETKAGKRKTVVEKTAEKSGQELSDEDCSADDEKPDEEEMDLLYLPTPMPVVEKMLELAQVNKNDVVYDLGCGDARIVVTAARKYGARGVGVDLNPERIEESLENVRAHKVQNLVTIKKGNVLEEDVREATVVTLYLLPELVVRLEPILKKQLKPGSRVVSHAFTMDRWPIEKEKTVRYDGQDYNIFLYVVPERKPDKKTKKKAK